MSDKEMPLPEIKKIGPIKFISEAAHKQAMLELVEEIENLPRAFGQDDGLLDIDDVLEAIKAKIGDV